MPSRAVLRRAIGYVRVSVDHERKVSSEIQAEAIEQLCAAKGWKLVHTEVEGGRSAATGRSGQERVTATPPVGTPSILSKPTARRSTHQRRSSWIAVPGLLGEHGYERWTQSLRKGWPPAARQHPNRRWRGDHRTDHLAIVDKPMTAEPFSSVRRSSGARQGDPAAVAQHSAPPVLGARPVTPSSPKPTWSVSAPVRRWRAAGGRMERRARRAARADRCRRGRVHAAPGRRPGRRGSTCSVAPW
jgi:hypothetical protein